MAREFERRIKQLEQQLDDTVMAQKAYQVFEQNTPELTGNAKRKTILRANVIEANYPYAGRLDDGYSKKKPNGMTEPTIKFLKDYVKKVGK